MSVRRAFIAVAGAAAIAALSVAGSLAWTTTASKPQPTAWLTPHIVEFGTPCPGFGSFQRQHGLDCIVTDDAALHPIVLDPALAAKARARYGPIPPCSPTSPAMTFCADGPDASSFSYTAVAGPSVEEIGVPCPPEVGPDSPTTACIQVDDASLLPIRLTPEQVAKAQARYGPIPKCSPTSPAMTFCAAQTLVEVTLPAALAPTTGPTRP
jgi:hypothetical protein